MLGSGVRRAYRGVIDWLIASACLPLGSALALLRTNLDWDIDIKTVGA